MAGRRNDSYWLSTPPWPKHTPVARLLTCTRSAIYMGFRLPGHTWLQPDVSITHAGQTEGQYYEGAPAIAIEVVTPEDRAEALDRKTELYFRHGAREVWHLYPQTRRLVVYAGTVTQVRVETEAVTTPLLPGFALSLRDILGS